MKILIFFIKAEKEEDIVMRHYIELQATNCVLYFV